MSTLDFDLFNEQESAFERIGNCGKKIYAYGTGNGCEKLIYLLEQKGINLDGIFVSDDFSRGQNFCGFDVKPLSEAEKMNEDLVLILAFGTDLPDVMKRIDDLESKCEVIAPDMALFDNSAFDKTYFLQNFSRAQKAYDLLADEKSRKVFVNLTLFKITGRLNYLREIFSDKSEAYGLLNFSDDEICCDMGAYNGDTVLEFAQIVKGKYQKIYAVEPEKKNFQKCVRNCITLDNTEFHNCAAWSEDMVLRFDGGGGRQAQLNSSGTKLVPAKSLDSLLNGRPCTYAKYDVEGADFPALKGSELTIKKYSPKISASVYHHPYDYFEIPLYINRLNDSYKFYLRQFPYYPAWETNLYCIK